MSIIGKEQLEKQIGETKYLINALPAMIGLSARRTITEGGIQDPVFIQRLILDSVTVDGMKKDDNWFNSHFSRNYQELDELIKEVLTFNFPELEGKLVDTSE